MDRPSTPFSQHLFATLASPSQIVDQRHYPHARMPDRPFANSIPDWATTLPVPKSNPAEISIAEVAELVRTKKAGTDYLVVDVRRTDFEVSTSFLRNKFSTVLSCSPFCVLSSAPAPLNACDRTRTYARQSTSPRRRSTRPSPGCSRCCAPSRWSYFIATRARRLGRGARVAAYYQDALEAAGVTMSEGRVLTGGIKAWVEAYGDDKELTAKL